MPLVSIREYARQKGVTHPAVLKAIKAGKIPTTDGKIDPAKADAAWGRNRAMTQPSKMADMPAASVQRVVAHRDGGSVAHELYNAAKARREAAKAKNAELDLKEREGELLPAAEVGEAWASGFIELRDRLLAIPDEVCDLVAACTDPVRCRELVLEPIRAALTELARVEENA